MIEIIIPLPLFFMLIAYMITPYFYALQLCSSSNSSFVIISVLRGYHHVTFSRSVLINDSSSCAHIQILVISNDGIIPYVVTA